MAADRAGEAVLDLAWPIDLTLTVMSHGWARLAPWRWDSGRATLSRQERIGGRVGILAARQPGLQRILVHWEGFGPEAAPEALRRVGRWISADWDPAPAIAALGGGTEAVGLIARGSGRMLRCSSFFEDFANTVLTINTSWSSTCRMAAALVEGLGGGVFPDPARILDCGEERLRREARLGFRAATLIGATRRMVEDGVLSLSGEARPERLGYDYLLGLPGIGPYAAAHCRMLLQDFSRIPVDSVVTTHLRERHGMAPAAFAESRAGWGDYLGLGYRLARLSEKLASEPHGPAGGY